MKNNSSSGHGGSRPGAGRPKGSMNDSTKERMLIKQAFQERVAKVADKIFNAQYNLAVGEQYLMRKYTTGSGAKQRTVVEVVDDEETIKQFLNDELNNTNDEDWYFLSTKPANGMALDSLLDRAFGKADSKLQLGNDPESPITNPLPEKLVNKFTEFLKEETKDAQDL